jgi:hypothetical protein
MTIFILYIIVFYSINAGFVFGHHTGGHSYTPLLVFVWHMYSVLFFNFINRLEPYRFVHLFGRIDRTAAIAVGRSSITHDQHKI